MSKKKSQKLSTKKRCAQAPSAAFIPSSVPYDLVVVGGGAAGLTCALFCAQQARFNHKHPRILILEAGRRIGASIMRSGNGRCNFSNAHLDIERYHQPAFVREAYEALEANESIPSILSWFESLGLVWMEMPHSHGLLYPFSRKANSVLDILCCGLEEYQVEVAVLTKATRIARQSDALFVVSGDVLGQEKATPTTSFSVSAHQVAIAVGGDVSYLAPQSFCGLAQTPSVPLLGPLKVSSPLGVSFKELDGIRIQARLSLPDKGFSEEGEILFRTYGLSGIVVFNASRYVSASETLLVDLMPDFSFDELVSLLKKRIELLAGRNPEDFLTGFLAAPLAHELLKVSGCLSQKKMTDEMGIRLAKFLKSFPVCVEGIADERACQVRRGGVAVEVINPKTLSALSVPGLYVLGEALDVDGPCGGYNLHWAWTSGLLSGWSIAQSFLGRDKASSDFQTS